MLGLGATEEEQKWKCPFMSAQCTVPTVILKRKIFRNHGNCFGLGVFFLFVLGGAVVSFFNVSVRTWKLKFWNRISV